MLKFPFCFELGVVESVTKVRANGRFAILFVWCSTPSDPKSFALKEDFNMTQKEEIGVEEVYLELNRLLRIIMPLFMVISFAQIAYKTLNIYLSKVAQSCFSAENTLIKTNIIFE